MKKCINNVVLLANLISTQQLYCMNKDNKDNVTKSEQQETIKRILANKEMETMVRNKLRPKILAQQQQIEQRIDMELLRILAPGSIIGAVALFLFEFYTNKFLGDKK